MFVIGTAAPASVDAMGRDGQTAGGVVVFEDHHEGPRGFAHGGVITGLLDDLCASVQTMVDAPRHSVTRELTVRFHKPTPLNQPLDARAAVIGEEGDSVTVEASIRDGETVLVEATARFRR